MTELRVTTDPILSIARGLFPGITHVNKFGRSTDIDTALKDVWDDITNIIWDAPTTARLHDIVSTSAADDGAPAGAGARTIRVFGLTSWSALEVSEDVIMDGLVPVTTGNAYVIIHRMQVLTKGATGPNVGTITATAQVDGTVTAQMNPLQGQTQMAIYGVPSVQTAYLTDYYASMNRTGGATALVDISLLVNPEPDVELLGFLTKHTRGLLNVGTSAFRHPFNPYLLVPGPAIIKIQAIASAVNTDVSAGFDVILVEN